MGVRETTGRAAGRTTGIERPGMTPSSAGGGEANQTGDGRNSRNGCPLGGPHNRHNLPKPPTRTT